MLSASADAYISEVAADQKANFGQESRLRVSGVAGERLRTLVAFDFSSLPAGGSIRSAVLRFALSGVVGDAHTLSLYALAQEFNEGKVSWERATQSAKWLSPGGDTAVTESASVVVGPTSQAGVLVELDVSADVSAIAKGSWPSYGWVLTSAPDEPALEFTSRESAFSNERPQIEIVLCP